MCCLFYYLLFLNHLGFLILFLLNNHRIHNWLRWHNTDTLAESANECTNAIAAAEISGAIITRNTTLTILILFDNGNGLRIGSLVSRILSFSELLSNILFKIGCGELWGQPRIRVDNGLCYLLSRCGLSLCLLLSCLSTFLYLLCLLSLIFINIDILRLKIIKASLLSSPTFTIAALKS